LIGHGILSENLLEMPDRTNPSVNGALAPGSRSSTTGMRYSKNSPDVF